MNDLQQDKDTTIPNRFKGVDGKVWVLTDPNDKMPWRVYDNVGAEQNQRYGKSHSTVQARQAYEAVALPKVNGHVIGQLTRESPGQKEGEHAQQLNTTYGKDQPKEFSMNNFSAINRKTFEIKLSPININLQTAIHLRRTHLVFWNESNY